jgi:hypothetical protein
MLDLVAKNGIKSWIEEIPIRYFSLCLQRSNGIVIKGARKLLKGWTRMMFDTDLFSLVSRNTLANRVEIVKLT